MRILITEDDGALAEALRFALSHAGYAVPSNSTIKNAAAKRGVPVYVERNPGRKH